MKWYLFGKSYDVEPVLDSQWHHLSVEASSEKEALEIFFDLEGIPEDEKAMYFAKTDVGYLESLHKQDMIEKDYEITGSRRIEI